MSRPSTPLPDDVAALVAAALGRSGLALSGSRLSGGASRETWSVDVEGGGEPRGLIVQRARPGAGGSLPMGVQAELLRVAADAGVPVARLIGAGANHLVCERLDGETIARRILRDDELAPARVVLVDQVGAAAAALHRVDPAKVPTLPSTDQLASCRALLDVFPEPYPTFEWAARWLSLHRPPARPTVLAHGDLRLGNLLVDASGLRAVLDWELAHLGDPVEDLGWFCVRAWRFGAIPPAGGVGTREQLLAAYRAAGGDDVELDELRWWEVLGTLKWGLICRLQAETHLSGAHRSVELATIGRRVCETEWDLHLLLGGTEAIDAAEQEVQPVTSAFHGRPTAAELLAAVREFLAGDVAAATSGRTAFHVRVATNALAMVERELADGGASGDVHAARLRSLGCADDAEVVNELRAGRFDADPDALLAALAASAAARLAVANPGYA